MHHFKNSKEREFDEDKYQFSIYGHTDFFHSNFMSGHSSSKPGFAWLEVSSVSCWTTIVFRALEPAPLFWDYFCTFSECASQVSASLGNLYIQKSLAPSIVLCQLKNPYKESMKCIME